MSREEDLVEVAVLSRMVHVLAGALVDAGDELCPPPDPERPCMIEQVGWDERSEKCTLCWKSWARKVAESN